MTVLKRCLLSLVAALVAGCGAPQPRPTQEPPGENATPPSGVPVYRIDSRHSEVTLLVYRAGPMAKLGHNHVIVNRAVTGWVAMRDGIAGATLFLSIGAADFVVDPPEGRAAEGADFSEEVSDSARAGTRHNMLSDGCLDAEHHPSITLNGRALYTVDGKPEVTFVAHVAGHDSALVVPFTAQVSANRIAGSGTVVLRQSDLGLAPFSTLLGALQVQNEITVKFDFVAEKS